LHGVARVCAVTHVCAVSLHPMLGELLTACTGADVNGDCGCAICLLLRIHPHIIHPAASRPWYILDTPWPCWARSIFAHCLPYKTDNTSMGAESGIPPAEHTTAWFDALQCNAHGLCSACLLHASDDRHRGRLNSSRHALIWSRSKEAFAQYCCSTAVL